MLTDARGCASRPLRRALKIRESTRSPDNPFIGTTYHELGETELRLRRFPDAEADLRRALGIREKSLEPTSFYAAQTLDVLAELYRDTQRYHRAAEMHRRAMKQWEGSGREDANEMVPRPRGATPRCSGGRDGSPKPRRCADADRCPACSSSS